MTWKYKVLWKNTKAEQQIHYVQTMFSQYVMITRYTRDNEAWNISVFDSYSKNRFLLTKEKFSNIEDAKKFAELHITKQLCKFIAKQQKLKDPFNEEVFDYISP